MIQQSYSITTTKKTACQVTLKTQLASIQDSIPLDSAKVLWVNYVNYINKIHETIGKGCLSLWNSGIFLNIWCFCFIDLLFTEMYTDY